MELNKFLVKAKNATYASTGEGGEKILEDGSRELTFEEGEFRYRDRYFGFNPFAGEEVVWQNGRVIWAMNYYGKILSGAGAEEELYSFLKEVMKQVGEDRPFRGPSNFKKGNFEYFDESVGDVNDFSGVERILRDGKEVYGLMYHGGLIAEQTDREIMAGR